MKCDYTNVKLIIDEIVYEKGFHEIPFEFEHEPRGWLTQLGFNSPNYTLKINGVDFSEMDEAPPRERAALARSAISMQMNGPKK